MKEHEQYVFFPPVLEKYEPESLRALIADTLSLEIEKHRKSITLRKIELDIICFLAENGPHSAFDVFEGPIIPRGPRKRGKPPTRIYEREIPPKRDKSKALAYDYKRILRHIDKLVQMGLLKPEKLKRKNILSLTFNGFYIYLRRARSLALRPHVGETKDLDSAIKSNSKLLPFAKYWSEIVQIVGQNKAHQSLDQLVSQQIYKCLEKIEKINLEFDLFWIEPSPVFPKIGEHKINKEIIDFLSTNLELRNSYISYLATHDIFFLTSQKKWSEIDSCLNRLQSEKALAFFEKRNIQSKPLFIPGTRLKELFPRFATVEYFFTGMLMEKLLWKESKVKENSNRTNLRVASA